MIETLQINNCKLEDEKESNLPDFPNSEEKIKARERNVIYYKKYTGRISIPEDKEYWTLCCKQSNEENSEINQMIKLGLIKKEQFHGVDKSRAIIYRNDEIHPEAYWYLGDWNKIFCYKKDNANFIYLDTTSVIKCHIAMDMLLDTMRLCKKDTFICFNTMLNNPYAFSNEKFDPQCLIDYVYDQLSTRDKWIKKVCSHPYKNKKSRTKMITFYFYKFL